MAPSPLQVHHQVSDLLSGSLLTRYLLCRARRCCAPTTFVALVSPYTNSCIIVDTSSRSSCVSLAKEDCQEQSYIVLKIAHINMKVYPPFLSFLTIHSFHIILNSTFICNTEHLGMKWRFINSCQNSQEPIRIRSLGRVILFRFLCSFGTG
jgi:hypothetical protein